MLLMVCHQFLKQRPQPGHTLPNYLRIGIREIDAHGIFTAAIRVEGCTRNKGHFPFDGNFKHLGRVHPFWQDAPQEHATLRFGPAYIGWEEFFHRLEHHIAAFFVNLDE